MKIITIASLKGGVGKTTIAANLAMAYYRKNMRVLAIDFDANNNLTDMFCRDYSDEEILAKNSYQFLSRRMPANECIVPVLKAEKGKGRIDCMPSVISLHSVAVEMRMDIMAMVTTRDSLRSLDDQYDVCVIDTAPSRDYTTHAGMFVADCIVAPINYGRWSVQAVRLLTEDYAKIKEARGRLVHGSWAKDNAGPKLVVVRSAITPSEARKFDESQPFPMSKNVVYKMAALRSSVDKGVFVKKEHEASVIFSRLAKELL